MRDAVRSYIAHPMYQVNRVTPKIKPASSISEAIEFSFATKMSLAASFSIGDASNDAPKMRFFLAPRTSDLWMDPCGEIDPLSWSMRERVTADTKVILCLV